MGFWLTEPLLHYHNERNSIVYIFWYHSFIPCLLLLLDEVGPEICKIYTFANETNVHNYYNVLMLPVCRFEMHEFVISAQYHSLYNQCLPLTAILYRPYGELSIVLLWGWNWYNYSRQGTWPLLPRNCNSNKYAINPINPRGKHN